MRGDAKSALGLLYAELIAIALSRTYKAGTLQVGPDRRGWGRTEAGVDARSQPAFAALSARHDAMALTS